MGHLRISGLPDYPKWQRVAALLHGGGSIDQVASATLQAADRALARAMGLDPDASEGFADASHDHGLTHTVWLLTQVTLAARTDDLAGALRQVGLHVSAEPGLFDVVGSFTDAVDAHLQRCGGRTHISEMAQFAAAESLTALCSEKTESLFGTTPHDVQRALRSFSGKGGFATLAHDFFARLSQRYLAYHLDRELSNHVGAGKRFADIHEHNSFNESLRVYCRQVATITREFAGGWYSKANFEGGISPRKAQGFVHVALKKIRAEIERREAV